LWCSLPGLRRDQLHAEDLLDRGLGLGAGLCDLDPAALAAAAGVDLCLDDHDLGARLGLHPGDRRERVLDGHRRDADRDGHP